jgi:23S rRNA-/tRNA-specific pseudouridylate synthase
MVRRRNDSLKALPVSAGLHVVGAGSGWIAVEKPPGISVHNDPGMDACAMAARLVARSPGLAQRIGCLTPVRFFPVHRLDQATSGLLLLACRRAAAQQLSDCFRNHQVRKSYVALVVGRFDPRCGRRWGVWDAPLSNRSSGRRRPSGSPPRRAAVTRYRVWGHAGGCTLIECRPETGRIHQIRRHACMAGHPVVGDRRYGSVILADRLAEAIGCHYHALHCRSLVIPLPGGAIRLRTRRMPERFRRLVDAVGPADCSDQPC